MICPFCQKNEALTVHLTHDSIHSGRTLDDGYRVICGNKKCDAQGPRRSSKMLAETAWKRHHEKWQEYEREYILPCFKWAEDLDFDLKKAVHENAGKNCVQLLIDHLVKYKRAAKFSHMMLMEESNGRVSLHEQSESAETDRQQTLRVISENVTLDINNSRMEAALRKIAEGDCEDDRQLALDTLKSLVPRDEEERGECGGSMLDKMREVIEKTTYEVGKHTLQFQLSHAVFPKGGQSSLCYCDTEYRAQLIADLFNEVKEMKKLREENEQLRELKGER